MLNLELFHFTPNRPADTNKDTVPVSLTMSSTQPSSPVVGWNYEAPFIGTSISGGAATNDPPTPMPLTLTATVTGLSRGKRYNLHRYDFVAWPLVPGPLNVPTSKFNANRSFANSTITFTATGVTYQTTVTGITAAHTVVFRCVLVSAP